MQLLRLGWMYVYWSYSEPIADQEAALNWSTF